MKLQNRQGGRIFLQNVKKPDRDDWENGQNAMECAPCWERSVNQLLPELHKLGTEKNDPHLCDFIDKYSFILQYIYYTTIVQKTHYII